MACPKIGSVASHNVSGRIYPIGSGLCFVLNQARPGWLTKDIMKKVPWDSSFFTQERNMILTCQQCKAHTPCPSMQKLSFLRAFFKTFSDASTQVKQQWICLIFGTGLFISVQCIDFFSIRLHKKTKTLGLITGHVFCSVLNRQLSSIRPNKKSNTAVTTADLLWPQTLWNTPCKKHSTPILTFIDTCSGPFIPCR